MTYVPQFLAPSADPAPLEGTALQDFLQAWIVGITGLDGKLVRPVLQGEQPNIPEAGTAWCAFTLQVRPSDDFPYVSQEADGAHMQRHESIEMLCSFYDTGSGADADKLAARMRDGALIPQNREYLLDQSFNIRSTSDLTTVPTVINTRWLYRVDLPVTMTRVVERVYDVPSADLEISSVILHVSDGQTRTFPIEQEQQP